MSTILGRLSDMLHYRSNYCFGKKFTKSRKPAKARRRMQKKSRKINR